MELHDENTQGEVLEPRQEEQTAAPEQVEAINEQAAETAEMPDEEAVAADLVEAEEQTAGKDTALTKAEIIERLKTLAEDDSADITNEEINRLKQQFYHLRNEEIRVAHEAFVASGANPEDFAAGVDPDEDTFRTLLNAAKERKAEQRRALDQEQQANLEKKRALIAELTAMSGDADSVNLHFNRAREIQTEFTAVGAVPDTEATAVWKEYQDARERFYDQLKINKELRDYDFKKNLAEKQLLIEEAQKLTDEPDVITAFRRLQDLHDKWRQIGPVAKDLREDIWVRFKDASASINKRYQAHFEERKAREAENEAKKTAICERIEALDWSELKTFADWDKLTKEFLEAQNEWKTIGFASRKSNNALFARFRQRCDDFFTAKAQYFKSVKEELSSNLAKKTALVDEAEALQSSTEWRQTTDRLVELQKQWKAIGPVPKKYSDALWKRFLGACDTFFENKKRVTSGQRQSEQANLKLKQEIIDRLAAMTAPDAPAKTKDEAAAEVADLRSQWDEIGHVPFKMKDKIYDSYRELLRAAENKFDLRGTRQRMDNFRGAIADMGGDNSKLNRERDRLIRQFEQKKQELQTYENNMGFLSLKSKGSNSLLKDMERRMQQIRDDLATLEEKIKLVKDSIDN